MFNEVISSCDHPQNVDCNEAPWGQGEDNGGVPEFEPIVTEDQAGRGRSQALNGDSYGTAPAPQDERMEVTRPSERDSPQASERQQTIFNSTIAFTDSINQNVSKNI